MRRPARWMHQLNERILEHLRDEGWASARTMGRHFRFTGSEDRIEERCEALSGRAYRADLRGSVDVRVNDARSTVLGWRDRCRELAEIYCRLKFIHTSDRI